MFLFLRKGHLPGQGVCDAGRSAGAPGKASSAPGPLAHLHGGRVLTEAWTAHLFAHGPHPRSGWAGDALLPAPLTALSLLCVLWLSLSTQKTIEFQNKKATKAHPYPPSHANEITEAWHGEDLCPDSCD